MKFSGWFLKIRDIFQFEVSAMTDLWESVRGIVAILKTLLLISNFFGALSSRYILKEHTRRVLSACQYSSISVQAFSKVA